MTESTNPESEDPDRQLPPGAGEPSNRETDSTAKDENRRPESRQRALPEYHDSWYRNGTMREEVRETVEQQVSWLEQLNEKALGLLRFNAILLGLLVPVFSFLMEFEVVTSVGRFYTPQMVIGVGTLIASTAGAGLAYTSSSMDVGVSDSDVEAAKRHDLTDAEVHDTLVESYAGWIRSNRRTIHRNAVLVTVTVGLTVTAVVFLSLGFASALFDGIPTYVKYTAYAGLALVFGGSQYF